MRTTSFALALAALTGCSAFGLGGDFVVEARAPDLVLRNETDRTVRFVVFESSEGPYIDPGRAEWWPTLAAGESLSVAYGDLTGYDEGDEFASVFWTTSPEGRWRKKSVRL